MTTNEPRRSGTRRGLGRGLDALLSGTDLPRSVSQPGEGAPTGAGLLAIPIDQIGPNPHQPRTEFEEATLLELASSIQEHGIIQPLIVTRNPERPGHYWLVAGERRWRAAQLAGLTHVPAITREATSQQLLEWALVENVQRADLNPLEEAAAYQELMTRFGLTQSQIGERVGRSRSAVANTVRLLQLPAAAQQALTDQRISAGHARTLLALPDEETILAALRQILARDLNVRQAENLVRDLLERAEANPPEWDGADEQTQSQLREMENRFRSALSTKVSLRRRADGSGQLIIHFYSDDDLNVLFEHIAAPDSPMLP